MAVLALVPRARAAYKPGVAGVRQGRWRGRRPRLLAQEDGPLTPKEDRSQEKMTAHTRKLIAAVLLLIFSVCYFTFVVAIAAGVLPGTPVYAQLAYYFAVSLLWVAPSGLLIRWAQRPRRGRETP